MPRSFAKIPAGPYKKLCLNQKNFGEGKACLQRSAELAASAQPKVGALIRARRRRLHMTLAGTVRRRRHLGRLSQPGRARPCHAVARHAGADRPQPRCRRRLFHRDAQHGRRADRGQPSATASPSTAPRSSTSASPPISPATCCPPSSSTCRRAIARRPSAMRARKSSTCWKARSPSASTTRKWCCRPATACIFAATARIPGPTTPAKSRASCGPAPCRCSGRAPSARPCAVRGPIPTPRNHPPEGEHQMRLFKAALLAAAMTLTLPSAAGLAATPADVLVVAAEHRRHRQHRSGRGL